MRTVRTREIQSSKREAKHFWKTVRNANRQCKVPTIPGEPPESNVLANCHIIGEPCLAVIARGNHIYEWHKEPTVLWDSAFKGIKADKITSLPWDMGNAVPFKERGNSIGKCVWRFACNYHDNKVFKRIDTPDMDLTSPGVQFLLGFRTIAATTTQAESHLKYFEEDFPKRPSIKRILNKYPQAESVSQYLRHNVNHLQKMVDKLTVELSRWQEMYRAQPAMGYSIITYRRTANPMIRSAGAGVVAWSGQSTILAIILPRSQDGQTDSLSDIVVTCLRPKSWPARLYLRWKVKRIAEDTETLLSNDPVANIPSFENTLQFFYVSPDDFDNDSILNGQQRQEIHARIARDRTPIQS